MLVKNIGYAALFGATAFGLILGSAGTGEAKAKKETMAELEPIVCLQANKPVCAVKGGQGFTYHSACFASKDGAKIVSQGTCKVRVAKKMDKMDKKTDKKPEKKM